MNLQRVEEEGSDGDKEASPGREVEEASLRGRRGPDCRHAHTAAEVDDLKQRKIDGKCYIINYLTDNS